MTEAAAIERMAATLKGLAAARVGAAGAWKQAGDRSAASHYPTCAVQGCSAGTWLENDHRVHWAASHLTVLDLLDRLCRHHHDIESLEGWALVPGRGKRAFVAPSDPRHPRHCLDPPSAA